MSSYITPQDPGGHRLVSPTTGSACSSIGACTPCPARHEWVKTNEEIPEDAYERYFRPL